MCSAHFIPSLLHCLWSRLWLCATRFARFRRFARFVQLPPVLPLELPLFVLHVLHVLQIPCDRLWMWIQNDKTTESSGEGDESSDEEEEAAEGEEEEEVKEGSDTGSAVKAEEDEPSLAHRAPPQLSLRGSSHGRTSTNKADT